MIRDITIGQYYEKTPFRNGTLKSSIDTGRYTADYL